MDMINEPILSTFSYLQGIYGCLSSTQLREKEIILDNYIYDPAKNVDSVLNKIQEFQDLCSLLGNPKNRHTVNYLRIPNLSENGNFHG